MTDPGTAPDVQSPPADTDAGALPRGADGASKEGAYAAVRARIHALLDDDHTDWVAAMATVASELHHSFEAYDWTGFYRVVAPRRLAVGPYQGSHGCLHIEFERGVCGAAARTLETQLVPDVHAFPGHIACSASTRSEIVVPVVGNGRLIAVLDVDSNDPAAFDGVDRDALESLCAWLGERYA